MEKRLRNELIEVIAGLIMIIVGGCLLMSKTSITSAFLESKNIWNWWKILLVLVPLIVGIIMLAIKPHFLGSKIVALVGAVLVIVVIFMNTTIIIQDDIAKYEWIIYGMLILGGLAIIIIALFLNRKKND